MLVLTREPVSGYDLNRVIEETISHFWVADQAQVYRSLKKLEEQKMVKCTEVDSEKGPSRKVYRRTALGRKELVRWLKSDPNLPTERAAYVAQLVFLWEAESLEVTTEFIAKLRSKFEASLNLFRAMEQQESSEPIEHLPLDAFHGFLGLRLAVDTLASKVAWCDWAIGLLRKRMKKKGKS